DLVPPVQPHRQLQVAQLRPQDPLLRPRERTQPHRRLDTSPPPRHATPPRGQHSEEGWGDPVGAALAARRPFRTDGKDLVRRPPRAPKERRKLAPGGSRTRCRRPVVAVLAAAGPTADHSPASRQFFWVAARDAPTCPPGERALSTARALAAG